MKTDQYETTRYPGIKANRNATEILLDFRLSSKRYRKKISYNTTQGTRTDRLKAAVKALADYKDQIAHRSTLGDIAAMSMDDYFKRTEDASDRSADTRKRLRRFWERYISPVLGALPVSAVTPAHITAVMTPLRRAGLADSTRKKALECLVPIFRLAQDEEVITRSPVRRSHNVKRDALKEKKVILNAEEKYIRVHTDIWRTFKDNPKILALVLLCFNGRRFSETAKLQWSDVDLHGGTYVIHGRNSKTGTDMVFTLPADVKEVLSTLPRVSSYIFHSEKDLNRPVSDIRHHVYRLRNNCNIPELSLHWMRNLVVSALSAKGVSAVELSSLLGHNDPNTLKKYLTMQRQSTTAKIDRISQEALKSTL